jgi:hypothetical protein
VSLDCFVEPKPAIQPAARSKGQAESLVEVLEPKANLMKFLE